MTNKVRFNSDYPDVQRSEALYRRACAVIPGATQTLAKGATQYVDGVAPKFLNHGRGARVWDVDGNEYLDFVMGLGPISLGYAYPAVDAAIRNQLEQGISFSLVHPLEVEVAELIRDVVPCAQRVRFSKTGADATSAAVRLARAFTGRDKVLCCGYHGWHDWYIGTTSRPAGVPAATARLTETFAYNDLVSVARKLDADTACVILEPMVFEYPAAGFLEGLRELCERRGAVLIFDEMWTGFRLAPGGAQERFGVTPDLACFSKAIANGMPLSVLAGRADIMELSASDVFFYTTFGGETLSLAAAKATLHELRDQAVPARLEQLGERLRAGIDDVLDAFGIDAVRCAGAGCRTQLAWNPRAGDALLLKSFVQQELIKRGILWSGFHALSFSHQAADIDYLVSAYREVLPKLQQAIVAGDLAAQLRGRPVQPVFRPPATPAREVPRSAKEPSSLRTPS